MCLVRVVVCTRDERNYDDNATVDIGGTRYFALYRTRWMTVDCTGKRYVASATG